LHFILLGRAVLARTVNLDELGEKRLARSTAGTGLAAVADGVHAALPLLDRADDSPLGDQVAVANLRVVGHGLEVEAAAEQGVAGRRGGQEIDGPLGQRLAALEEPEQRARWVGLAEEDRADELAVAYDEFLVDAARRIEVADHFAVRPRGVNLAQSP